MRIPSEMYHTAIDILSRREDQLCHGVNSPWDAKLQRREGYKNKYSNKDNNVYINDKKKRERETEQAIYEKQRALEVAYLDQAIAEVVESILNDTNNNVEMSEKVDNGVKYVQRVYKNHGGSYTIIGYDGGTYPENNIYNKIYNAVKRAQHNSSK